MRWPVVLLAVAVACWGPPSVTPLRGPTLLVTNRGLGTLALYDEMGPLARVMPGESRCIRLHDFHRDQLLRYVIEGRGYDTPWFDPGDFEGGWRMEIGTLPLYQGLSLRPLRTACNPAARPVVP